MRIDQKEYVHYANCPKSAYFDLYSPGLAQAKISDKTVKDAEDVRNLAIDHLGATPVAGTLLEERAEETRSLLSNGIPAIGKATFITRDLQGTIDVLRKVEDGYEIVLAKASNEIKPKKCQDVERAMAFDLLLLKQAGIRVSKATILHLNDGYVRHGKLDLDQLFVEEPFWDDLDKTVQEAERNLQDLLSLRQNPNTALSKDCQDCPYFEACHKEIARPSVLDIRKLQNRYDYLNNGIETYQDVLNNSKIKLTDAQRIQVETTLKGEDPYIDKAKINEFLKKIRYPLYHLDFETANPAVPLFDETRPYQQVPFQYSLHIEQADGSLEHREFLAEGGKSPLRAIAESLVKNIPEDACCLAYSDSFERGRINELAATFKDLAPHLKAIAGNFVDLLEPFKNLNYYDPAMGGSASIKAVLPALYPDDPSLDYHNLKGVHKGDEASAAWLALPNLSPDKVKEVREELLRYCELDTFAMVKVLQKLREAVAPLGERN